MVAGKVGERERCEADLGIVTHLLQLSSPDPWLKEAGVQNYGVTTDSTDFTTPVTAPARSKHPLPMRPQEKLPASATWLAGEYLGRQERQVTRPKPGSCTPWQ